MFFAYAVCIGGQPQRRDIVTSPRSQVCRDAWSRNIVVERLGLGNDVVVLVSSDDLSSRTRASQALRYDSQDRLVPGEEPQGTR